MTAGDMLRAIYDTQQTATADVNIVEVNGVPTTSIADFKADVTSVGLKTDEHDKLFANATKSDVYNASQL